LRDVKDQEIFAAAKQANAIVMTKNIDFVHLVDKPDICSIFHHQRGHSGNIFPLYCHFRNSAKNAQRYCVSDWEDFFSQSENIHKDIGIKLDQRLH